MYFKVVCKVTAEVTGHKDLNWQTNLTGKTVCFKY